MTWLLHVHAAATLAMTGLIWFVQIVHYPLMARVPSEAFESYQAGHMRRTTWVVAPLMLAELATACALAYVMHAAPLGLHATSLVLLAVVWLTTHFWFVPLHGQLGSGFDRELHARLVAKNWVRTAAWSGRGVVALMLIAC